MLNDRIKTLEEALQWGVLEDEEPEPGIKIHFNSKNIDRIDLYFSGAGIKEEDEYGKSRIKHRAVCLKRREFKDRFQA